MDISIEQIKEAEAGKPVRVKVPGHGDLYLVNLEFYKKLAAPTQEADPELDAFLELAAQEADEIARENPY
jgi:hypothetical protein